MRSPGHVPAVVRRQLETMARRNGSVLAVAGPWEGAPVRLRVGRQVWRGIGYGFGRLRARQAEVIADGRGALVRPRSRWLWLPGPDGKVAAAEPAWSRGDDGWRAADSG
jgi:hypothetical protein